MTRIMCLGGNIETEIVLQALIGQKAQIVGVFCADDALKTEISDYADIASIARSRGLPCLPISNINSSEAIDFAAQQDADYLFVLGWSQIIESRMLAQFPKGVIGSHPAPLPFGKGRAPVPWTILRGDRRSAISLFKMTERIDEGALLIRRWFDIGERPYAMDVYDLVTANLKRAFCDLACDLDNGIEPTVKPADLEASIYARRRPEDGWINFDHEAEYIDRLVRAVSPPYPGAYSYLDGRKIRFLRAEPASETDMQYHGVTGQILRKRQDMLLIQCADSPIWLGGNNPNTDQRDSRPIGNLGDVFGYRVEDKLQVLESRITQLEEQLKAQERI